MPVLIFKNFRSTKNWYFWFYKIFSIADSTANIVCKSKKGMRTLLLGTFMLIKISKVVSARKKNRQLWENIPQRYASGWETFHSMDKSNSIFAKICISESCFQKNMTHSHFLTAAYPKEPDLGTVLRYLQNLEVNYSHFITKW